MAKLKAPRPETLTLESINRQIADAEADYGYINAMRCLTISRRMVNQVALLDLGHVRERKPNADLESPISEVGENIAEASKKMQELEEHLQLASDELLLLKKKRNQMLAASLTHSSSSEKIRDKKQGAKK